MSVNAVFGCVVGSEAFGELEELTRVERRVAKGAALYRNGDPFESIYAVRDGSFKSAILSAGGTEKVTGIHLPAEIMGLDAINAGRHTCEAIALQDSVVCAISFARLSLLALRVPELQRQFLRILSADITRDQGLLLLMGAMTAEQRIAAFLLSLSRRHEKFGRPGTHFGLCMTRYEIGSYLGLTLETVSRVFARMQREGVIAARPREIELKDLTRLHETAGPW